MSTGALEAVQEILAAGGEPDDALRRIATVLAAEPAIEWAGIAFLEEGSLTLGPESGEPDESRRDRVPIVYQGSTVGELLVDGDAERVKLERVAALIAGHVLIGWDTGGEAWEP